jgi:hypothetical protein
MAGRLPAARISRPRRKMSVLRDSGMDRLTPALKAKKSFTLMAPITAASAPAAAVTQGRLPMMRNRPSQAAMKAKYMRPENSTKMPPMSSMRRRSR